MRRVASLAFLVASFAVPVRSQESAKRFAERGKQPEVDVGDPQLNKILTAVAGQASTFWQAAPSFTGHEALKQKAITRRRRTVHFRQLKPPEEGRNFEEREMAAYYGLTAFSTAPEALREVREIVSIGEKQIEEPVAAREKLEKVLLSKDDARKQALRSAFEKENLRGAAIDFGQLILLFIRSRMPEYSFVAAGTVMVGAEQALVIAFEQREGSGSVRISEPGRRLHSPLQGKLFIRQADYLVLRIALVVDRLDDDIEIRDEATVDYAPNPSAAILPASVLYRRYLNDKLYFEITSQYSDWRGLKSN